ncbi:hypothetical protein F5146DRAFT_902438, partial [Armillaria mellea]
MNTLNASTGFSPFELKSGHSPRLMPPLAAITPPEISVDAKTFMQHLELDVKEATDSLITAKITQSHFANHHCAPDIVFKIGDRVMLSTKNRRQEYVHGLSKRCTK